MVQECGLEDCMRLWACVVLRDGPDFTCFQAGSETAAISRGVTQELGELKNTQGRVLEGPFANGNAK